MPQVMLSTEAGIMSKAACTRIQATSRPRSLYQQPSSHQSCLIEQAWPYVLGLTYLHEAEVGIAKSRKNAPIEVFAVLSRCLFIRNTRQHGQAE
jgi:hypothetical protein